MHGVAVGRLPTAVPVTWCTEWRPAAVEPAPNRRSAHLVHTAAPSPPPTAVPVTRCTTRPGGTASSASSRQPHNPGVRIGVVSDTHLPRFGRSLPRALVRGLELARVDLILHLGDFTGLDVPKLFEAIAPFDAVAGNNDGPELLERFGRRKVLRVGGARLGLTHGDLPPGRTTPERAAAQFAPDEVEAVLFGHSHIPLVRRLPDGRWLLNPGSPTDKRRQPRYSWALVTVEDGEISPELRLYDGVG